MIGVVVSPNLRMGSLLNKQTHMSQLRVRFGYGIPVQYMCHVDSHVLVSVRFPVFVMTTFVC